MMVSLVAALGTGGEIGHRGAIPWHIGEDFKNFKKITMNHCILMGRKTFQSIGRCLPGRTTIVMTRRASSPHEDALTAKSPAHALRLARERKETELFVVGGGEIYRPFLPLAGRMYLSRVDYSGMADTFFPDFDRKEWSIVESKNYDATGNSPAWKFELWERGGHSAKR